MRLTCGLSGTVSSRPVLHELPSYQGLSHLALMCFASFAPTSIKRAVVLGLISRIDRFTYPEVLKPTVLSDALRLLHVGHGFPIKLLRRWAFERNQVFPWINTVH